jgi:hypothetical protein
MPDQTAKDVSKLGPGLLPVPDEGSGPAAPSKVGESGGFGQVKLQIMLSLGTKVL